MTKNKPRTYTLEFKQESAALAVNSEQPITYTSKELGISDSTLHGWIKKYCPQKKAEFPKTNIDVESENKQLRKELSRAKRERDILKKAMACFSAEML
jgi:transposase